MLSPLPRPALVSPRAPCRQEDQPHHRLLGRLEGQSEGPTGVGRVRGALHGSARGEQQLRDPQGREPGGPLERHPRESRAKHTRHYGDAVRWSVGLHRPGGLLLRGVHCLSVPQRPDDQLQMSGPRSC